MHSWEYQEKSGWKRSLHHELKLRNFWSKKENNLLQTLCCLTPILLRLLLEEKLNYMLICVITKCFISGRGIIDLPSSQQGGGEAHLPRVAPTFPEQFCHINGKSVCSDRRVAWLVPILGRQSLDPSISVLILIIRGIYSQFQCIYYNYRERFQIRSISIFDVSLHPLGPSPPSPNFLRVIIHF